MRYHAIMANEGSIWITHANFATEQDALDYLRPVDGITILGVVGAESPEASLLLKGEWVRLPSD